MKRIMQFKFAGKNMHLPRLIGAFVLVAAFLLFLSAGAWMFESWENVQQVSDCIQTAQSEPSFMPVCQENALKSLGIYVRPDQSNMTLRQITMSLLNPIAVTFFWLAVFLVGVFFYRTGSLVVPIEETVRKVKSKKLPRRLARKVAKKPSRSKSKAKKKKKR